MEASWNRFTLIHPGEKNELLPSPVQDCVLLSKGSRYEELVRRARQQHGSLDAAAALRLMDRPVSMNSNLHNVLFEPASSRFWLACATKDRKPAADQPYREFRLSDLLQSRPDDAAPELK